MLTLKPPFTVDDEIFASASVQISSLDSKAQNVSDGQQTVTRVAEKKPRLVLPAAYHDGPIFRRLVNAQDTADFISKELSVERLNLIHKHLTYAGLQRPCRPLHYQLYLGRDIRITERADMHMLWTGSLFYVKPLPDYLLSHDIWAEHLCKGSPGLFDDARGFLLSYMWLIAHKSDLLIAHEKGLVAEHITWDMWASFSETCLRSYDLETLQNVNVRYHHGELRLNRINWIYRLCSNAPKSANVFRAYQFGYTTYGSYVESNLTSLTVSTVYAALVLTAMQVGQGTSELGDNVSFQRASYGFTVFCIMAPLIIIGALFLATALQVVANWRYTFSKKQSRAWPQSSSGTTFDH